MSYSDKKKTLQEIRSKYREAKAERDQHVNRRNEIDTELSTAYDRYIEAQASEITGDATAKEARKAENIYMSLKSERDELDKQITLSEKVVSILSEKMRIAEADFIRDARKYHSKKLKPHFSKIDKALETINQEIDALNEYRQALQKDRVHESILKGIKHHSRAVITTENKGSLGFRNLITSID